MERCAVELTSSFVSGLVGCVLCLAVIIPHIFSSVLRADGIISMLIYSFTTLLTNVLMQEMEV